MTPGNPGVARIARWLRSAFTERLPYKAAALFLACVLWLVVSAEEPDEDRVAVRFVPVLDSSLTLREPQPEIRAEVVGRRRELQKLLTAPPYVSPVFGPETPDSVRWELRTDEVEMPIGVDGVDVRRVQPNAVVLRFTKREEKLVPVRSRLRVLADSGFRLLGQPVIEPESVRVIGTRAALDRITEVATQRADVVVRDTAMVIVPLDTTGVGARVWPVEVQLRAPVVRDTMLPIPGLLPWNRNR